MKKKLMKLMALAMAGCLLFAAAGCGSSASSDEGSTSATEAAEAEPTATYKVGIVNYVDDPSLEQIQNAIQAELDAVGAELGVEFIYSDYTFNAQADQTNLNSIGAQLVSQEVDVIVAIATPTALVMQNYTADTDIPVIFSAVSDPVGAGLVDSMEVPGGSITGTSDAFSTAELFEIALTIDPDITKVGLLYDSSQDSSLQSIEDAKAYLDEVGIEYVEKTGTTTDDLSLAADALIAAGCQIVFTPSDNTVQVAEPSIYEKFIEAGVKHYAGADSFALVGAFCGYGVDYANLGTMTADMVIDLLVNGADPATTPVQTFDNGKASINTDTCAALGLDYDTIAELIAPLCTEVEALTTSTSFED